VVRSLCWNRSKVIGLAQPIRRDRSGLAAIHGGGGIAPTVRRRLYRATEFG
jgi:hypothetical protein